MVNGVIYGSRFFLSFRHFIRGLCGSAFVGTFWFCSHCSGGYIKLEGCRREGRREMFIEYIYTVIYNLGFDISRCRLPVFG